MHIAAIKLCEYIYGLSVAQAARDIDQRIVVKRYRVTVYGKRVRQTLCNALAYISSGKQVRSNT